MLSFSITGNYTDLYELTMAETYFLQGRKDESANFDYFFRKLPTGSGYVVFAGLGDLLDALEDLQFTKDDIDFLRQLNFNEKFLEYLESFSFRGDVWGCEEGEVVFPNCPLLRVEGGIIEVQLIETLLLNILNFESLVATKASRIKHVAGDSSLSDFGLRRAQGPGGIFATRASVIGGFESTSNVAAAQQYHLKLVGTMAHSFVESYDSELEAFRCFARCRPHDCVFLVDTYDSLRSGIPNAIAVAKEMEMNGMQAQGVRLDSGDLAYLSRITRKMLDEAGLNYMKIVASNQLDEFVIRSLKEQHAPIDIFGVGTRLVTGQPDAALDGVYKLSMVGGRPRLKLSESNEKITLPGIKQVVRIIDRNNLFHGADVVRLDSEGETDQMFHPLDPEKAMDLQGFVQQPLIRKLMSKGKKISVSPSLKRIAAFLKERLDLLPAEYKRFENPHTYKVGISKKLMELRDDLRHEYRKRVN